MSDFRGAASQVSPDYFTDPQQIKALIEAFFGIKRLLTRDQQNSLIKGVIEGGAELFDEESAATWLTEWARRCFSKTGHLPREAETYIEAPKAWIRENMDGFDGADRGRALAYLTVMCWIFAPTLDELDEHTRALMHGVCLCSIERQTMRMNHLDVLHVSWHVSEEPLVCRLLVNPWPNAIELVLEADGRERQYVCMAPGSCWLSLWVGDVITCLKSSIAANGEYAYACGEHSVQRMYLGSGKRASELERDFMDFAVGKSANVYKVVRGGKFAAPEIGTQLSQVLAVFCSASDKALQWAALHKDGSITSRGSMSNSKDVIAVVCRESNLHLITRRKTFINPKGEYPLDGQEEQSLMADMLAHLRDVTEEPCPEYAEKMRCRGYDVIVTAKVKLIAERKE